MSQTAEGTTAAPTGSRELLETVLRHLRDGIVVTAVTGERLYANDEAARLTDYASADELMAAGLEQARLRFEIMHPDGTPLDPAELPARRALAGGRPEPMLVRFRAGVAAGRQSSLLAQLGARTQTRIAQIENNALRTSDTLRIELDGFLQIQRHTRVIRRRPMPYAARRFRTARVDRTRH